MSNMIPFDDYAAQNGAPQLFVFDDIEVRAIQIDGDPWFIAADVAKALGFRDSYYLTRGLDDDERGPHIVGTPSGDQTMTVINESGLYSAILRSRVEGAQRFKRWVTHEVLPAIRKHGGYLTGQTIEAVLEDPDTIIALATKLKDEKAARVRAEKAREAMASYAQELEPKSEAYDAFLSTDGTYSVGAVAKMHGVSQNKLFLLLRNNGIFIAKGAMHNTPYQQYLHHFDVKAYSFVRHDGTTGSSYTTRIQPSGVDFVRRKLGLTLAQQELEVQA